MYDTAVRNPDSLVQMPPIVHKATLQQKLIAISFLPLSATLLISH
jgi:hypothetical protein